jgi:hypothetical protein
MGALTLTRAGKSRDGEWSTDDYDVFEGPRLIGHILLSTTTGHALVLGNHRAA